MQGHYRGRVPKLWWWKMSTCGKKNKQKKRHFVWLRLNVISNWQNFIKTLICSICKTFVVTYGWRKIYAKKTIGTTQKYIQQLSFPHSLPFSFSRCIFAMYICTSLSNKHLFYSQALVAGKKHYFNTAFSFSLIKPPTKSKKGWRFSI